MNQETTFACVTNDSGLVSGILHVSPMFMRYGAPTRGRHTEARQARTRRTDARQAWRQPAAAEPVVAERVLDAGVIRWRR